MAILNVQLEYFGAYGGDTGFSEQVQMNIVPADVLTSVALYGAASPPVGTSAVQVVGITHYRRRLPDGSDQDIDFSGGYASWPAAIYDHISSITFTLTVGVSDYGFAIARLEYWG